jgi:hypothetical protein
MWVVWKLDRLARSLRQLLTIGEECRSLGVDLVSLRQNIDTTLPAGRLTFQILGAVAEFERELLRERVKAGMKQARRTGKCVGRPPRRRFAPGDVERMRELRAGGTSVRKLAMECDSTQWMVNGVGPSPHYSWVSSCITSFEACSAFTRVTTCRLAESPYATLYTEGSGGFVASTAAPIATGWSDPVPGRVFHPAVDQRLLTAHCNGLLTSLEKFQR